MSIYIYNLFIFGYITELGIIILIIITIIIKQRFKSTLSVEHLGGSLEYFLFKHSFIYSNIANTLF